jgi:lysyl-tRNA synthetase class I
MLKFILKHLHRATCSHLLKRWEVRKVEAVYTVYDVSCLECGKLIYSDISQIDYDKYYHRFKDVMGR